MEIQTDSKSNAQSLNLNGISFTFTATLESTSSNFIAGRPKAALLLLVLW